MFGFITMVIRSTKLHCAGFSMLEPFKGRCLRFFPWSRCGIVFWPEQWVYLFVRTRIKKNIPSLYLVFQHRSTSQPLPLPFWLWWESRLLSLILILPLKLKTIVEFTLTFFFPYIWKSPGRTLPRLPDLLQHSHVDRVHWLCHLGKESQPKKT